MYKYSLLVTCGARLHDKLVAFAGICIYIQARLALPDLTALPSVLSEEAFLWVVARHLLERAYLFKIVEEVAVLINITNQENVSADKLHNDGVFRVGYHRSASTPPALVHLVDRIRLLHMFNLYTFAQVDCRIHSCDFS